MGQKMVVRKKMVRAKLVFNTRRDFAAGHEAELGSRLDARGGVANEACNQSKQKSRDQSTWWAVTSLPWLRAAPEGHSGIVSGRLAGRWRGAYCGCLGGGQPTKGRGTLLAIFVLAVFPCVAAREAGVSILFREKGQHAV